MLIYFLKKLVFEPFLKLKKIVFTIFFSFSRKKQVKIWIFQFFENKNLLFI